MGVNPYRQHIYQKQDKKVIIECSRCSGCGYQNPLDVDSSICFSCMGAGIIEIHSA